MQMMVMTMMTVRATTMVTTLPTLMIPADVDADGTG